MKEIFKQGIAQVAAFFGFCTIMCSALIGILIASGGLLLLRNEGANKIFLLPMLAVLATVLFLYMRHKRACAQKECITIKDRMFGMMFFMFLSIGVSVLFMLYVFIPWWIPNYKGGPLLP